MSVRQRQSAVVTAAQALRQAPEEGAVYAPEESDTRPAVPGYVIRKLLAFAAALIIVPILTYFATVNTLFAGNATKAASLGALMANLVLFAYIAVVIRDDLSEQEEGDKKKKEEEEKENEDEGKKEQ